VDKDTLWKQPVDSKYKTNKPNVLHCKDVGASNFWKGVMWTANVDKMRYRWKVGDG
jgi:purine nucleoside permease